MFGRQTKSNKQRDVEETGRQPYNLYVEKDLLPVVVWTTAHRIEGMMHITYHHRALDILCGPEPFLPVTLAKVYDAATDTLISERDFIAISKSHIVFLYETGKPFSKTQEPDSEGTEQPDASPKPDDE